MIVNGRDVTEADLAEMAAHRLARLQENVDLERKAMNHTSDEQARFQTASVHQVLPSSMHGGLVCLCGAELPKHRDATEHIIDAYDDARRQYATGYIGGHNKDFPG